MNEQSEYQADAVVVGAGAVGLCCAYYLKQAGVAVIVLDPAPLEERCSYGNAGFITPSHFIPLPAPGMISKGLRWLLDPESPFYIRPRLDWNLLQWLLRFQSFCTEKHLQFAAPVLRDLSLASLELFQEMSDQWGHSFYLQRNGLLEIYREPQTEQECRKTTEIAATIGIEAQLLSAAEVQALDPNWQFRALGGLYFRQDSHIDPGKFLAALQEQLETNGVAFVRDSARDFLRNGRQITGVVTNAGQISASHVVIASGSWAPQLAKALGGRIPIQAAKGYSVTLPVREKIPSIPLICHEAKVAITPLGDRIRFAGTLELAGLNLEINRRRVGAILKAVPKYLAGFDDLAQADVQPWAGLRPCTPDGLPIVGELPEHPNIHFATGHAMLGISLAPVTGFMVAKHLAGEKVDLPLETLSPTRFN